MWTAVIAALATALAGFLAGTALDVVRRWDEIRHGRVAKKRLREALADTKWPWRKCETLRGIAGSSDEDQVHRWLMRIGARKSNDGKDLWTMRDRVPEAHKTDEERMEILRAELSYGPQHITELATASGQTESATVPLLRKLDAVPDPSKRGYWLPPP